MSEPVILDIQHLQKKFGDQLILKDISLQVHKNEVVVIVGPSGCGKSTFLRCINGLEPVTGGQILFNGTCISDGTVSRARICQHIGMVFQSYDLFSHMTVMDNLLLAPVQVQKRDRKEAEEEARRMLKRIGLEGKEKAWPRELSGGQQQRIAMIRALILHPQIMLFDEVTASLDPEMVREVLEVIMDLAGEGMTLIIVTHEMTFARAVADRVLFFDQGVIAEEGRAEQFFTAPSTERAQKFLHSLTFDMAKEKRKKEIL